MTPDDAVRQHRERDRRLSDTSNLDADPDADVPGWACAVSAGDLTFREKLAGFALALLTAAFLAWLTWPMANPWRSR